MEQSRYASIVLILLVTSLFAASSKLVLSWRNPASSAKNFRKILVIGMSDKVEVRANFEDALSAKVGGLASRRFPEHYLVAPGGDQSKPRLHQGSGSLQ